MWRPKASSIFSPAARRQPTNIEGLAAKVPEQEIFVPSMTLKSVDAGTRWQLHLSPVVAVVFLSFYGQAVCPFIDSVTLAQVMSGLGLVCLAQILMREGLYRAFPEPRRAAPRWPATVIICRWPRGSPPG